MKAFLEKHDPKITGVLSCFDRMLFRGYLPIMSGAAMAQFLSQADIKFRNLKTFLTEHAATLKAHAQAMAAREGRPYIYLASAGIERNNALGRWPRRTAFRKVWFACLPNWSPVIPSPSGSSRDVLLSTPLDASACIFITISWIGNLA